MEPEIFEEYLAGFKKAYPKKFVSEDEIFSHIRRGDHILSLPAAASLNILSKR